MFFKDPVLTPGGQNYEKSAIHKYIKDKKKHPETGHALKTRDLIGNTALKDFMKIFQGGKWDSKVRNGL